MSELRKIIIDGREIEVDPANPFGYRSTSRPVRAPRDPALGELRLRVKAPKPGHGLDGEIGEGAAVSVVELPRAGNCGREEEGKGR